MHESPVNQAAGLQGWVQPSGPRMMAMVSHGDEKAELPLLWRLCWTLADLGYPVTVLDATTFESVDNPGLDQLLENPLWHSNTHLDAPAWTVIPSGKAIQDISSTPLQKTQMLRRLGHLFPQGSVVILYSRTEWLVPLIGDSEASPLLAVSPVKASLLSSYQALKRLLINGKLEPTIVNLTHSTQGDDSGIAGSSASASNLIECARYFLGYNVKAINIPASGGEEHSSRAIQNLALRLMESAVLLDTDSATMGQRVVNHHFSSMDRFAGSH